MRSSRPALAALLVTSAACSASLAAEPANSAGWFAGIAAGTDHGRVDCLAESACDHRSTFIKLAGGYRFDATGLELQAAWFRAGTFRGADIAPLGTHFSGRYDVSGLLLGAGWRVGIAPSLGAVARAGLAINRTRFDYDDPAFGNDRLKTSTQPYLGAGLDYALTPALRLGVDLDWTRFKANRDRGALQLFGLSAQYAF